VPHPRQMLARRVGDIYRTAGESPVLLLAGREDLSLPPPAPKTETRNFSLKADFSAEPVYHHKTIVMGMLDRDMREVRAKVIPNVSRETLQNAVLKHVKYGSRVFTDLYGFSFTSLPTPYA
jgi:hypothetical protein